MLARRFLLSWWRSPINLLVQLGQYCFFALMIAMSLAIAAAGPAWQAAEISSLWQA